MAREARTVLPPGLGWEGEMTRARCGLGCSTRRGVDGALLVLEGYPTLEDPTDGMLREVYMTPWGTVRPGELARSVYPVPRGMVYLGGLATLVSTTHRRGV